MTTNKLTFSGTHKGSLKRIEGTGVNQIDGEMVILNGSEEVGPIQDTSFRVRGKREIPKFEEPVTKQKDLSDLQKTIMKTVIEFCKERKLTDIDAIAFTADGLQESIEYDKWTPGTDSSISAHGYEDGKYKLIGEWL